MLVGREVPTSASGLDSSTRLDDGAARLAEPRLARQLLLAVGLVAREADRARPSSRCSGSRSSHQFQSRARPPPGRMTRCSSGSGPLAVEPVERLPREGARRRSRPAAGSTRRSPSSASASGTATRELLEHRGSRLDRHDVEAERDEAAGQLPRSRADVEDARAWRRARAARPPSAAPLRGTPAGAARTPRPRTRSCACGGQTRLDGQRSLTTQSSQRGRRASQTRRPCQIRRCGKRPQSARGTSRTRSRSIFTGILLPREPEPLREAPHVRVDDDPLRLAELGGDDVARLARDARQPDQLFEAPRHLAVELLEQHPHRPAQRLRLLAVEAGREDVALELLLRHGEVVLGLAVLLEQRLGDAVDVHVGRLRREHHRDEQLERAAEAERDRRVGVLDREPLDDRADPLLLRPDALAGLLQVATRQRPPGAAGAGAGLRRRGRAPGSRRRRSRSASAGTRRPGSARSRRTARPRARARRRA